MMCGGASDEKPADDQVQEVISSVKIQVEEKLGRQVTKFTLVSYKTQVVAGLNYFAKVDIGEGDDGMVHLRIYKDLKQQTSLHSIQHPKSKIHAIEYF